MSGRCLPSPLYTKEAARLLGPLELAYIGDTVFDLFIRSSILSLGYNVRDMHRAAVSHVNAAAQSMAFQAIQDMLDEEEMLIVKRGRNAHARHQAPKSASVSEYANATGLEALMGYLYLIGNFDRLNDILDHIWEVPVPCPKRT